MDSVADGSLDFKDSQRMFDFEIPGLLRRLIGWPESKGHESWKSPWQGSPNPCSGNHSVISGVILK